MEELEVEPGIELYGHRVGPPGEHSQRRRDEYQEPHQRAGRVAWQTKNERPGLFSTSRANSKPERLSGLHANLVKHPSDAASLERGGNQVALAGGDASGQEQDVEIQTLLHDAMKFLGLVTCDRRTKGNAPWLMDRASSMTAFELRIWPGPGTWSGSTSSSPVGKMASVGLGMTRTRVRPTEASSPRLVGGQSVSRLQQDVSLAVNTPPAQDVLAGSYFGGFHHDVLVHEPGVLDASPLHRLREAGGHRS